jgi:surface-anchored protein
MVSPEAELALPADPAYAVLGSPGEPVWILPQIQEQSILWLGWNSEGIPTGTFTGDEVQLRLVSVSGPGQFVLFTTGSFGEVEVLMNSADGLDASDSIPVPVPAHAHANWAFTQPGAYVLSLQSSGTLASGGNVNSPVTAFTFRVGDTASQPRPTAAVDGLANDPGNSDPGSGGSITDAGGSPQPFRRDDNLPTAGFGPAAHEDGTTLVTAGAGLAAFGLLCVSVALRLCFARERR